MSRLCLVLVLYCLSAPVWAFTSLALENEQTRQALGNWTWFLEDPTGSLRAEQLLELPQSRFMHVDGRHANKGKNDSTWWFRVQLDNRLAHDLRGFLEVNYPLLDEVELFVQGPDGSLDSQQGGDRLPFAERAVKVSDFWFPVELAPGTTTLLLRVKSASTLYVPLYFSSHAAGAAAAESQGMLNGAFFGVLLAMFGYNLFLFFSLREPAYFWYLVYSLNVALFAAGFDGLLAKLLPNAGEILMHSIYLLMFCHCLSALQFSRHFLQTPEHFPRLDRALRLALLVLLGGLLSGLLLDAPAWSVLASLAVLTVSIGLLLVGIFVWRQGTRHGLYFILAWGALLVALIVTAAGSLGLELFGLYAAPLVKIAVAFELITLSIGLADRINRLKEEGFRSRRDAELASAHSEAKSRFLAQMSHEIRTPLNGVMGMLQLLQQTRLDHTQQFYVSTIRSSGNSLLTVVNDILDYARINSGKLRLEDIEFDLEELVSEALSLFTAQALERHLSLNVGLSPGVPRRIRGDPTRLKQVLMNLLSNALKFTEQGCVELNIARKRSCLVFSVRDDGIGIPAEVLARLFQSFSQGDSSTTRRYGGSGLGLAISKELVELMGGQISAQSTPGRGSCFTFDIPLQAVEDDQDALARLLEHRPALLASLDGCALDTLSQLLRRWGMRTALCHDPQQLAEHLEDYATPPLLVLVAPWPGQPAQWLERLQGHLESSQRVLLICPPSRQALTEPRLRLALLAQPLRIGPLREALHALYQLPQAPQAQAPTPAAEPGNPGHGAAAPCVLIAEDNPVSRMVACGLLKKRGYRVLLAENGRHAVEVFRDHPGAVQLILMDCEMPELDGFEASRQIRRLEAAQQRPAVPIVALTAHGEDEYQRRGGTAGMNDFIGKPLDAQRLYACLDTHLRADTRRAATVPSPLRHI